MQHALEEIERMPGIGPKSAQRILNWLLTSDKEVAHRLADAIVDVKESIHLCPRCHAFAEEEFCAICSDPERDVSTICVVSESRDTDAIERTGTYQGLYHVLGGAINPMANIGPSDLNITQLLNRLQTDEVKEIIVALNPNIEGEATTTYLGRLLTPLDVKVTRLASGLPVGGDLEYADEITLSRALEGRREV